MTAAVWWQSMYGKLVQRPGGPIVPGDEHRCTGQSQDLPAELAALCYPDVVGIGSSRINWSEYPWGDSGGLLVRPAAVNGRWHLVACRVRGLSEGGEGTLERRFTQAHYLVAPVASLPELPPVGLEGVLAAVPMTEINFELRKCDLPPAVKSPLPPDWLEQVRPWLERLLCGRAVAVLGGGWAPAEFFTTACVCLACLPGALCWRLPVGGGLCVVPADVALGHGLSAEGEADRLVEGRWQGQGGQHLDRGRGYVRWLEGAVGKVKTVGELRAWVDQGLPGLQAWNVDPELPWRDLLDRVHASVRDVEAMVYLDRWLADESLSEPPRLDVAALDRPRAVQLVATRLTGRGIQLLPRLVGPDWADPWKRAGAAAGGPCLRPVRMLLGWEALDPKEIALVLDVDFPQELYARLAGTLEGALKVAEGARLAWWAPLLNASGRRDARPWLRHWREKHLATLLWKGCEIELGPAPAWQRDWTPGLELNALRDILAGKDPAPDTLKRLLELVPESRPLGMILLCKYAWKKECYATALLLNARLEDLQLPAVLSGRLEPEEFKLFRNRVAVLLAAIKMGPIFHWPDSLLKLVLTWQHKLPAEAHTVFASLLPLTGAPLARVLLGVRSSKPEEGSKEEVVYTALAGALTVSREVRKRLVSYCAHHAEAVRLTEALARWAMSDGVEEAALIPYPVLRFVRAVRQRTVPGEVPDLTPALADLAQRLLRAQSMLMNDAHNLPLELVERPGQLRAALAAATHQYNKWFTGMSKILADALVEVLKNPEERSFWDRQLERLGMKGAPGWRLLGKGPPARKLEPEEEKVLERVPGEMGIAFLISGWPPTYALLARMREVRSPLGASARKELIGKSLQQIKDFVQIAENAQLRDFASCLLEHIIQTLAARQPGISKQDLENILPAGRVKATLLQYLRRVVTRVSWPVSEDDWVRVAQKAYRTARVHRSAVRGLISINWCQKPMDHSQTAAPTRTG